MHGRHHTWLLTVLVAAAVAATDGNAGEAPLRIGLVVGPSGVRDPYFRGAYEGLRRSVRQLGVEGKVLTVGPREGLGEPTYELLARQGYDLVIGVGTLSAPAVERVARRHPRSRFLVVDASVRDFDRKPPNVRGAAFGSQEAAYLAGYLAALVERDRPGADVVSTVGGIKLPVVDAFIAGFQAGARKAVHGVRMLNGYSNDFLNARRCARVARQQIARGSGVVFAVAGGCGVGALREVKRAGVRGIGVDIDQSGLGPHILTSVVKRLDVAVFSSVQSFQRGRLRFGRDSTFRLRDGGVGLGRVSRDVPGRYRRAVDSVRRQIVAGRIRVPSTLRD